MQVYDAKTTGMHWHLHKDGRENFIDGTKETDRIPVSVALGGDPATIYAATSPMPRNISEYLFAGFLRKKGVEVVKCITNDLEVPANAEICPGGLCREG